MSWIYKHIFIWRVRLHHQLWDCDLWLFNFSCGVNYGPCVCTIFYLYRLRKQVYHVECLHINRELSIMQKSVIKSYCSMLKIFTNKSYLTMSHVNFFCCKKMAEVCVTRSNFVPNEKRCENLYILLYIFIYSTANSIHGYNLWYIRKISVRYTAYSPRKLVTTAKCDIDLQLL